MKVRANAGSGYDVQAIGTSVGREQTIQLVCTAVASAIERKAKRKYPSSTWLVVPFESYLVFKITEEDIDRIANAAAKAAARAIFPRIYLVGGSNSRIVREVKALPQ